MKHHQLTIFFLAFLNKNCLKCCLIITHTITSETQLNTDPQICQRVGQLTKQHKGSDRVIMTSHPPPRACPFSSVIQPISAPSGLQLIQMSPGFPRHPTIKHEHLGTKSLGHHQKYIQYIAL